MSGVAGAEGDTRASLFSLGGRGRQSQALGSKIPRWVTLLGAHI